MCIASSGVLVRLAETTPVTVAIFRCLYALPLLGFITWVESRRWGPLPARSLRLAWIAGVFFAVDLIFWHNAIDAVGAGLATVLGNLQVLVVGILAWVLLDERPHSTMFAAVPLVLIGVVLISGVTGQAYGKDPALGVVFGIATSLAYAAFILILRAGASDLRRIAGPLFHATLLATISAALYGAAVGGADWKLDAESHLWLAVLALTAQVLGWLLISRSLPRLPAAVTSIVLLLQPVGAMVLATALLDERPGPGQIAGAALILVGVVIVGAGHRQPDVEPEGALVAAAADD